MGLSCVPSPHKAHGCTNGLGVWGLQLACENSSVALTFDTPPLVTAAFQTPGLSYQPACCYSYP